MKSIFLLLLLFYLGCSFAQDQTANWYFGEKAGLHFNGDGSVTAINDGKLNTKEGCATISDKSGNLLFYTDGITVYNSKHAVIKNGQSLYGDSSSTQSGIIIPSSHNDAIYYIFTVDTSMNEENDPNKGLNYSTVDISANNGDGEVTQKNSNLLRRCSEKIAAVVKNCADKSVWVVTLAAADGESTNFNTFYAYEVNDQGVNTTPVKSRVGSFTDKRGYLKFTADGKKMVSANEDDGLYLYDFDPNTGVVSNSSKIIIKAQYRNPYGIEFSPSNQFLYVHTHSDSRATAVNHASNLLQYDLLSDNISNSEVVLDTNPIYRGALQLASNGKIYRTIPDNYINGSTYLGVINNPDKKGTAANYKHNAIHLKGGIATQGLPPFIQSFFDKKPLIANTDGTKSSIAAFCSGSNLTLEADNIANATFKWSLNGKPIPEANSNTLKINNITPDEAGIYELIITQKGVNLCDIIGEATVEVSSLPQVADLSISQCDIDDNRQDGFTNFNLKSLQNQLINNTSHQLNFYESEIAFANNTPITTPENYRNTTINQQIIFFKVEDENGCSNTGEIDLIVNPSPANLNSLDFYTCNTSTSAILNGVFNLETITSTYFPDASVAYFPTLEDVSLQINAINVSGYSSPSTTIYARVYDNNDCIEIEEINLVVLETPSLNLEASNYYLCSNEPDLTVIAPNGFDSYTWHTNINGEEIEVGSEQSLTVSAAGDYQLTVGYIYPDGQPSCTTSTTINVKSSSTAIVTSVAINDVAHGKQVTILTSGDGDYQYSLNNPNGPFQDSPILENVPAGYQTVYIRDKYGCGIVAEDITVFGFPKFFTPNADGYNDSWNITGLPENLAINVAIFDRYGTLMHQLTDKSQEGWDGTYNGLPAPATDYWVIISYNDEELKGHFTLKR